MPSAVRDLGALGIRPDGMAIRGIRYLDEGHRAEATFRSGPGRGVRRTELHRALQDAALGVGVTIESARVAEVRQFADRVCAGGFSARYLVAADGLHSPIRRQLGLDRPGHAVRRWGVRRHLVMPPWTDFVEVHWGTDCEVYVTPVAEDCVGVAVLSSVRRSVDEHLAGFAGLRDRCAGRPAGSDDRGAGPLHQRAAARVAGRVLLVGDAAGYVDALTGEGLAVAFGTSAALVAAVLADRPEQYEHAWRRISRRPSLVTRALLSATSAQRPRQMLVGAAERLPGAFSCVVNVLAG